MTSPEAAAGAQPADGASWDHDQLTGWRALGDAFPGDEDAPAVQYVRVITAHNLYLTN